MRCNFSVSPALIYDQNTSFETTQHPLSNDVSLIEHNAFSEKGRDILQMFRCTSGKRGPSGANEKIAFSECMQCSRSNDRGFALPRAAAEKVVMHGSPLKECNNCGKERHPRRGGWSRNATATAADSGLVTGAPLCDTCDHKLHRPTVRPSSPSASLLSLILCMYRNANTTRTPCLHQQSHHRWNRKTTTSTAAGHHPPSTHSTNASDHPKQRTSHSIGTART